MADELNLGVDAPDKVAGVLSAAASAYQASAVELIAAWQDRHIPVIWAAIASELDLAAWKIERSSSSGSTRGNPHAGRISLLTLVRSSWRGSRPRSTSAPMETGQCAIS